MAVAPGRIPGCRRATASAATSTRPGSTACSTASRRCRYGRRSWPRAPSSGCGAETMTRVAVVIVTYNSATVLGDALASLTDQGVDLTEVAVADNASKDESVI